MKQFLLPALLTVALVIPAAGCAANVKAGESQPPPGGMPALNRPSLTGTWWVLEGYGNPACLTAVIGNTRITLRWNDSVDGVSGNASCNLYGGKARIHDGMISISDIYQTEMACLTPGVMEQESKYLALLGKAETWNVEGGKLTVCCRGGEVLVFCKDESKPAPLSSLENTKWELTTFVTGDTASSLLAGTEISLSFNETATSVGGSGGTNSYGGDCMICGAEIKISNVFSTKIFNDNPPGRMVQESQYFELLEKATGFEATTARLTIYCQGDTSLVFSALQ